ncbi:hypothetical protein [Thioclava sp. F28-4]|uniref:hypothetical protein n=1 Tax=Thioclava sp. F28-4 TaxID=1915315 RepID=UPI0011BA7DC1|nr:hypothetical protein [Thioclava sp. F28-4]
MRAIFVVGTGRSGTHFTTRLLNGFKNINDPQKGREHPRILKDVAQAAIHHKLPSSTTENYYREHISKDGPIFLDQHHPNLFFTQHWSKKFEGITFIYPNRPTHQVVASMLRHQGVMEWYKYATNWKHRLRYSKGCGRPFLTPPPFPNLFLGIENSAEIRDLPIHLLCARRVIAHRLAYIRAGKDINSDMRSINYENLVGDPEKEFSRVFSNDEIEALGSFERREIPERGSLSKFREILNDKEVFEISEMERTLLHKYGGDFMR